MNRSAETRDSRPAVNLCGESAAFRKLLSHIARFANCEATVLIEGETGVGKELTARAIHYGSARAEGPFIPINCGSIPDSLLNSELFGHARGAFTDAREARAGLIAQAEGGTLFLDELEALTPQAQVSLLRFLQDREYRPLGAALTRTANVRVIAATNVDLNVLADRQQFRRDLIYRIDVLSIMVPPLRARGDDVILLAEHVLDRLNAQYPDLRHTLHREGRSALKRYQWPGNVRELENVLHREFLLSDERELRFASLESRSDPVAREADASSVGQLAFKAAKACAIEEFERAYVTELLARARGNVSLAARLAGKDRSRLSRLVRKYRLHLSQFREPRSLS